MLELTELPKLQELPELPDLPELPKLPELPELTELLELQELTELSELPELVELAPGELLKPSGRYRTTRANLDTVAVRHAGHPDTERASVSAAATMGCSIVVRETGGGGGGGGSRRRPVLIWAAASHKELSQSAVSSEAAPRLDSWLEVPGPTPTSPRSHLPTARDDFRPHRNKKQISPLLELPRVILGYVLLNGGV